MIEAERVRLSAENKEKMLEQMSELQSNFDSESVASKAFGVNKKNTIRSSKGGHGEPANSELRSAVISRAKNTYEQARKSLEQSRGSRSSYGLSGRQSLTSSQQKE